MKTILALEGGTPACSVALQSAGKTYSRFESSKHHAETVLPMIEDMLSESNCALDDVDAIAVGHGPGSFIGIRTILSVAQTIGFAKKIPLVSFSTLHVLAQTAADEHSAQHVLAAWDARMSAVYWGSYSLDSDGLMLADQSDQLGPPESVVWPEAPAEERETEAAVTEETAKQETATGERALEDNVLNNAANVSNKVAVGNAFQEYADALLGPANIHGYSVIDNLYPKATSMLRLAQRALQNGEAKEALSVSPVYLRDDVVHRRH